MNIKILSPNDKSVSELADMALKNRLYVSGWCLSEELINARKNPDRFDIRVAMLDVTPVGVMTFDTLTKETQCFVRKKYRRNKIGTRMVRDFRFKSAPCFGTGISGSRDFWVKVL